MKVFLTALFISALVVPMAQASNFSFTGSFATDDQIQLIYLSLGATSTLTFETLSYGGGTNSAGSTISHGGFDPRLTWFQSDGTNIGFDNGGHCASTASFLGACNDGFFHGTLSQGSYILALTQDGNDSNGDLSTGFSQQGTGDFTAAGTCTAFCDSLSGNQLNGNWAVDILAVNSASTSATPEPLTFLMGGSALALIGLSRRRRLLKRD